MNTGNNIDVELALHHQHPMGMVRLLSPWQNVFRLAPQPKQMQQSPETLGKPCEPCMSRDTRRILHMLMEPLPNMLGSVDKVD